MKFSFARRSTATAAPSYLTHFHLNTPPFAATAEGAFLYLDPERQQSLDMLQHLTQYSDEVLLVTGGQGAGKSTLCRQFLQRSEEHWRSCHIEGSAAPSADALFARLAQCYRLDMTSLPADQLLAGMQAQLNAMQDQQLAVLLVDDAQALSDDLLEIVLHLAQLEGEQGKLIRLILFSEPELAIRLAEPRFSALPPAHRIEMKGMGEQETAAYIAQRLSAAGLQGELPLSGREIRQIHRASGGMPGQINQQADQFLQQKTRSGGAVLNSQGFKLGVAAMAIAGTVLGLHGQVYEYLQRDSEARVSTPERPVVRLNEQAQPWAVVIRDGERIQISCGDVGDGTVGVRPTFSTAGLAGPDMRPLLSASVSDVEEPAVAPPQVQPEPVDVAALDEELAASTEPEPEPVTVPTVLRAIEPDPIIASDEPQRLLLRGEGLSANSRVALSRAGQIEVLERDQIEYLDQQTIALTVNTGSESAGWAVQLSTPDDRRSNVLRFRVVSEDRLPAAEPETVQPEELATATEQEPPLPLVADTEGAQTVAEVRSEPVADPAMEQRPTSPATPPGELRDTRWLKEQPADNLTVQLFATAEYENLQALLAREDFAEPLAQFMMERNGQPLYVLTHGSYTSRNAAERAAAAVPAGLQPWIRSMASVQQVMQPVPSRAPQSAAAAATTDDGLSGAKDDAWVWSQDPAHYTIQLAAASSEGAVLAAMRALNLPGERVVVETRRDGRPWYVLSYGSFADADAARGTIARLPEALRRAGPWPRSFASLQDEMGSAR